MKRISILFPIFFYSLICLYGQDTQTISHNLNPREIPEIFHIPPDTLQYSSYARIQCVIDSKSYEISSVTIFTRKDDEEIYKEFPMHYHDGMYIFPVIPEMLQASQFFYYITAEFKDYRGIAFPEVNPAENPVKVELVTR